ncbi:MAG TPA: type II toxin-antitoxin system VapC family toxin [Pyrinomonadaceae bacterium]|nr:type II toxin-antitoxin system VapC family toxin [Pyrinomonadaceae bacterium]
MPTAPAFPETSLILDNDIFTHWRNEQAYAKTEIAAYIKRLKRPPAIACTTLFETIYGIENSRNKGKLSDEGAIRYLQRLRELSNACILLPFEQRAANIAGYILPRLSKSDQSRHWRDVFAAATALAHSHGIATGNKRDFELIGDHLPPNHPYLRIALWKA